MKHICNRLQSDSSGVSCAFRFELETDDANYEYRKAVQKQRAEDDEGAANAQSHNEFIYM